MENPIRNKINELRNEIAAGKWNGTEEELWMGADVVIVSPEDYDPDRKTHRLYFPTRFCHEVTALFYEAKEICSPFLSFFNKFAFYGMMAEAGLAYIAEHGDDEGILLAIADELLVLEKDMNRFLYFAYGSNMDEKQMLKRCKDAILVDERCMLPDYRFDLDKAGVATVVPEKDSIVYGVLWSISWPDLECLDHYEGVRSGCYSRSEIDICCTDGCLLAKDVEIYISCRDKWTGARRDGYLEKIVAAASQHGFNSRYIQMLKSFMA